MADATKAPQKVLLVGSKRICQQIAYVLNISDYALAEKLTAQNFDQYRDYQIYICEFQQKSRKFVKVGKEIAQLNLEYLDDICRAINEEYYANRKRHANDLSKIKVSSAVQKSSTQKKYQKKIRKSDVNSLRKYLQNLKPSELLLYVLQAKPNKYIRCTRLETNIIVSGPSINSCCGVMVPFGNLLYDGELDEIYNSTYARIVKLSSLNRSYCLCNLFRWCKGYSTKGIPLPTERWETTSLPEYISVCFDRSCNLCCKSCRAKPYVMDNTERQRVNMVAEKLSHSGYLEKAQRLTVAGNGEVFYSPHYRQILMSDLQRKEIKIFSNGTLFNEDNWRLLEGKYAVIDVSISVDAATAETYQKLRGADFENLMKNLTMLSDLHRQKQIRWLTLNFVVQRDNFREMPAFVKLGRLLGVNRIEFQRMNYFDTSMLTQSEFLEKCLIIDNKYLDYNLWCVLQDPIFKDPMVDLQGMQRYIDASEKRYRQRYAREQRRADAAAK